MTMTRIRGFSIARWDGSVSVSIIGASITVEGVVFEVSSGCCVWHVAHDAHQFAID